MRKPFLLFLVLISIYCWLADVVDLFLYVAHNTSPHKNAYTHIGSGIILLAVLVVIISSKYRKTSLSALKSLFETGSKKEWGWLLLAAMPVIALGLFRSIYPDENFDTFHFELYLQEFDFADNKINAAAGAIRTYYFPISERIFGLFRHIFGYRAGALFNVFLLVAVIASAYDFIKKFINVHAPALKLPLFLPALLALFVAFADNVFSTMGTYKPDLIGVPLLLELLYLVFFGGNRSKIVNYVVFCLLASLTIAYKLTYLPYVAILMLIFFIRNIKDIKPVILLCVPFVILLFPAVYMVYNTMETGSPLFPFFNKYLHSSLYPLENFKDTRWGPRNLYETCFYHIVTWLDNKRCNEYSLFSYRLLFGFFTSIATVVVYAVQYKKTRSNGWLKSIAMLAILSLLFDYLCALTTGYYRYGMIVEAMYGLSAVLLLLYLQKSIWSLAIIAAFLFQGYCTFKNMYLLQMNLSWHDYRSLIHEKKRWQPNVNRLFNDYGNIVDADHVLPTVDAFVGLDPGFDDGLGRLLNKKAVIYDLADSRVPALVNQYDSLVRAQSAVKNFMVLGNVPAVQDGAVGYIGKKGYEVTDMYKVYPDFVRANEPIFLFKIKPVDTSKYVIKTDMHYFNTDTVRDNFTYRPAGRMKAFIMEAPYTFDWYPKAKYDLYINDRKYIVNNIAGNNRIVTIGSVSLQIHTSVPVGYLIITQEIIEKK